jgi:hypothetical protein
LTSLPSECECDVERTRRGRMVSPADLSVWHDTQSACTLSLSFDPPSDKGTTWSRCHSGHSRRLHAAHLYSCRYATLARSLGV